MRTQLLLGVFLCAILVSCGGGSIGSNARNRLDCTITGIKVNPSAATADHGANPPANTAQFFADYTAVSACQFPPLRPAWTASDPVNVNISSATDSTNGTATCLNPTADPVTVTATATASGKTFTATGTLTCN
jgi:hypothetical protein